MARMEKLEEWGTDEVKLWRFGCAEIMWFVFHFSLGFQIQNLSSIEIFGKIVVMNIWWLFLKTIQKRCTRAFLIIQTNLFLYEDYTFPVFCSGSGSRNR